MKRSSILVAIPILSGLIGVGILAREQIAGIPTTVEKRYEARAFDRQRDKAIKCANDQLEYSLVVGTVRSSKALMVTLFLLPDPDPKVDSFDSRVAQLRTIASCMDKHVREWNVLQAFHIELVAVEGFDPDGAPGRLIGANLVGIVTINREDVKSMAIAPDLRAFMSAAFDEGRITATPLAFFGQAAPVSAAWVDGKLVVKAAERYVAYVAEWNLLRATAK